MGMSDTELKPCPFCGGAHIIETFSNFIPVLMCSSCGATMIVPMDFNRSKKDELVKKWNTRKPIERIVEQLEEYLKNVPETNENFNGAGGFYKAIEIVKKAGAE